MISLIGAKTIELEVGSNFSDPGYYGSDPQDGPISVETTGSVDTQQLGHYVISYTAQDSQSNQAETVQRHVYIVDTRSPEIMLQGDAFLRIALGTNFEDPGAVAIDAHEGDLSVTTEGAVDVSQAGSYEIGYFASDSSGNTAQVFRRVIVGSIPEGRITSREYAVGGHDFNLLDASELYPDHPDYVAFPMHFEWPTGPSGRDEFSTEWPPENVRDNYATVIGVLSSRIHRSALLCHCIRRPRRALALLKRFL